MVSLVVFLWRKVQKGHTASDKKQNKKTKRNMINYKNIVNIYLDGVSHPDLNKCSKKKDKTAKSKKDKKQHKLNVIIKMCSF